MPKRTPAGPPASCRPPPPQLPKPSDLSKSLTAAAAAFKSGDLDTTESLVSDIIAASPAAAPAWHLRALCAHRRGQLERAREAAEKAKVFDRRSWQICDSLGTICAALGDHDSARQHFDAAIIINPQQWSIHYNLAGVLLKKGDLSAALLSLQTARQLSSSNSEVETRLAQTLLRLQRPKEALTLFESLYKDQPNHTDTAYNLAMTLAQLGEHERALTLFETALIHNSDNAAACVGVADCALELGRPQTAVDACDTALQLVPDYAAAHLNRGAALIALHHYDDAETALLAALKGDPHNATTLVNLGNLHVARGELQKAATRFEAALKSNPESPSVHWNYALMLLLSGNYRDGFRSFQWREAAGIVSPHPSATSLPAWDGQPLPGKRLLLHCEQGFGDTIHFVRFAGCVRAAGGQVVLECQNRLGELMRGCADVDEVIERHQQSPNCDMQARLLSLPHLLGTGDNLKTRYGPPATPPYLSARDDYLEKWRGKLGTDDRFTIGLAWRGRSTHRADALRSLSVQTLQPLLQIDNCRFVSLQQDPTSEEQAYLEAHGVDVELTIDADRGDGGAFLGAAAIVANVDLVITVDTAIAHLAGALGQPVWVLLHYSPDWRWGLNRETTHWYPSMRLWRQTTPGAWPGVVARMLSVLLSPSAVRAIASSQH